MSWADVPADMQEALKPLVDQVRLGATPLLPLLLLWLLGAAAVFCVHAALCCIC